MKYKQINSNVSKSVNKAAFKTDLPQFRITVEQVLQFVELCDSSLAVDNAKDISMFFLICSHWIISHLLIDNYEKNT